LSVCGGRFRKGLGESLCDVLCGLGAHVEEGDSAVGQGCAGLLEKAADDAGITGDDLQASIGGFLAEFSQSWVVVGGELTEVGNGLETLAAGGQMFENGVFDAIGHDLSVGAAAVEDLSGVGHERSGD